MPSCLHTQRVTSRNLVFQPKDSPFKTDNELHSSSCQLFSRVFEHIFKPDNLFRRAKTMYSNGSCRTECCGARQPDGLEKTSMETGKRHSYWDRDLGTCVNSCCIREYVVQPHCPLLAKPGSLKTCSNSCCFHSLVPNLKRFKRIILSDSPSPYPHLCPPSILLKTKKTESLSRFMMFTLLFLRPLSEARKSFNIGNFNQFNLLWISELLITDSDILKNKTTQGKTLCIPSAHLSFSFSGLQSLQAFTVATFSPFGRVEAHAGDRSQQMANAFLFLSKIQKYPES